MQLELDLAYNDDFPGESRANDPQALLFPLVNADYTISWNKPVSAAIFTGYIRKVIKLSNTARPVQAHKEPLLYTTHSAKVGGAVEFAQRGGNLIEGHTYIQFCMECRFLWRPRPKRPTQMPPRKNHYLAPTPSRDNNQ